MTENRHYPDPSERSPLLRTDQTAVNGTFAYSTHSSDSGCSTPILAADLERVVSAAEDAGLPGPGIGGGARSDADETGNGSALSGRGARPRGPAPNMKLLMPAISIGVYLCAVDQLLAVATYAKIGSDLKALNSTSWIATAYFLTLTSFQPLSGKLSDIFGRKECLLASYFIFGLGCLGCGLARDMTQLIIARAVSGIGGGGMTSVVSILLTDLVPLRERGIWQGYINIVYALGSATGAPIGGLLADSVGWRWSFIGQCPICLAAFAAVYLILKSPDMGHAHWREKLAKIDFLGAACLIAAVFSLLLALDNGSNNGWGEIFTIVSLALAPFLFLVFVLVEMKVASHPFAPGHIIFDRSLFACFAANFFGVGGQMPVAYYGMTVVEASLLFIPGSIAGVVASLGSGYIIKRTGRYYWLTVASYTTLLLSSLPLVLCTGIVTDSVVGTTVGLALSSFGNGAGLTTTLVGLISNSAPEDTAVVIACSYLFRSLGLSIGVSVMSAVMQQALRTQLATKLGDGDEALRIGERVRESLDYIGRLDPQLADVVRKSYRFGVSAVFMANAVFLVFALVAAFYIREKRVTKKADALDGWIVDEPRTPVPCALVHEGARQARFLVKDLLHNLLLAAAGGDKGDAHAVGDHGQGQGDAARRGLGAVLDGGDPGARLAQQLVAGEQAAGVAVGAAAEQQQVEDRELDAVAAGEAADQGLLVAVGQLLRVVEDLGVDGVHGRLGPLDLVQQLLLEQAIVGVLVVKRHGALVGEEYLPLVPAHRGLAGRRGGEEGLRQGLGEGAARDGDLEDIVSCYAGVLALDDI
ncbi:hypothetical protein PpBr36_00442 [Pyricularia pennisetigena]|uniref:hypothetical protein n=1 Tax=Pyricularia pennisetigena TaxID=1578925 RepID=UPI0011503332|nr:hypothetical protein PpBr36_00442 [Pyricularia pennisetigena]TLS28666.1 hypothetical protein PpBr36_00442 [Pyricularia pennisetigena]